jgi:hypothetical protein
MDEELLERDAKKEQFPSRNTKLNTTQPVHYDANTTFTKTGTNPRVA